MRKKCILDNPRLWAHCVCERLFDIQNDLGRKFERKVLPSRQPPLSALKICSKSIERTHASFALNAKINIKIRAASPAAPRIYTEGEAESQVSVI